MTSNIWKSSALVLVGGLGGLFGGSLVREASADPQPMMVSSLELMRKADADLEKATDDKGGHRAKARELLGKAMDEVKAAIAFDNKH